MLGEHRCPILINAQISNMADGQVEIIEFVCPYRKEINLYVTNITKTLALEDVEVKLKDVFSKFGLVYEVQVFESEINVMDSERGPCYGPSGYYAFVKFYSINAAVTAKKKVSGKWFLGGQLLKVQFANRKKSLVPVYPLHMSKCIQLANHYFGYNRWNTTVVKMEICPQIQDPTFGSQQTMNFMFACTVRLEICGCDCYCEGIGFGGDKTVVEKEEDPVRKMQLMGCAKKLAHRHAFENAFKRVLIIVTLNGKVAVEINQSDIYSESDFNGWDQAQGTVQVNYMEEADFHSCGGDESDDDDDNNNN